MVLSGPLPSKEESERETKKRDDILTHITPPLEKIADAAILVGSLAYGRNTMVRSSSDIDLLVLVTPDRAEGIVGLFPNDWTRFAVDTFVKNVVQHFTLISYVDDVKVEYHFWNKEYEYPASRLEIQKAMRLTKNIAGSTYKHDFSGKRYDSNRPTAPYGEGFLQEYPIYDCVDGHFIPYDPLTNLLMNPKVLFTRDAKLYENIEGLWTKMAEKLSAENAPLDLTKTNILNTLPAHESYPEEFKQYIVKRTADAVRKVRDV